MKNACIAFLILFFLQLAHGQNIRIGLYTGYGFYQLSELKTLQTQLVKYYDFLNVKAVQSFPGYIDYMTTIEYSPDKINFVGVNASYFTTGGRNSVKDYSGEYKLDMPLQATQLGLTYRNEHSISERVGVYARLTQGLTFSKLSISEFFTIYNVDTISNYHSFVARSFYFLPSAGVKIKLGYNVSADLCLGYEFDIQSNLHEKSSKKDFLYDVDGNTIHVNWSGFRVFFGLAYDFLKSK
jgi:hypothetical protein